MIWRTRIGDRTLWLLEERVQVRLRRRVLLAVDTSDSCWPGKQQQIEAAVRAVSYGLQAHDECHMWIMGRETPAIETRLADDSEAARAALSHRLCSRLVAETGGTWLRETAEAMTAAARESTETLDYLLVVTDGSIFDAEAVPSAPPGSVAAIYQVPSEAHSSGTRGPSDMSGVSGWPGAPEDLGRWLALDRAEARLEVSGGHQTGYRFEVDSCVDPVPVVWPQRVVGDFARFAFVSDTLPPLYVVTSRGGRGWRDSVTGEARLSDVEALPRQLRDVAKRVWGLQLDWRVDVFEQLADTAATLTISCPNCRASYAARDVRDGRHVFCEMCRALVLVSGWARRDDPVLRDARAVCWNPAAGVTISRPPWDAAESGLSVPLDRVGF